MADDPKQRRPEDPLAIHELLAGRVPDETDHSAQNQQIDEPIRPLPKEPASQEQIMSDDPGASASGFVSMLVKGQIGEPDPSADRHVTPGDHVILPAIVPVELDPLRPPASHGRPRRGWLTRLPLIFYMVAAVLFVAGLWASLATASVIMQQPLIPFFEWEDDASQLFAMLMLLCMPAAIILGMFGLYIKERNEDRRG